MQNTQAIVEPKRFTVDHHQSAIRHAGKARTLLRFVIAAIESRLDIDGGDDGGKHATHWNALTRLACTELASVRDVMIETVDSPSCDWVTPLTLTEAIDESMWAACGFVEYPGSLGESEYSEMLNIAIEAIDQLISDFTKAAQCLKGSSIRK